MYGYGYYSMFDPTMILVLIGVFLSLGASAKVNSTYARFSRVRSMTGMTGAEAARQLLNSQGIYDVQIRQVAGSLTDHYDPRSKVLRLSDATYNATSVAAIGVAAHECGHAMQDKEAYAPLKLRGSLVPVANIGSNLSWVFIILGIIMGANQTLLNIGILLFSLAVIFQLVTLPVEFNASSRALRVLKDSAMMYDDEVEDTRKVLSAAALTYVASAAAAILSLLRLVILFGGGRDD